MPFMLDHTLFINIYKIQILNIYFELNFHTTLTLEALRSTLPCVIKKGLPSHFQHSFFDVLHQD